MCVYIYIYIYIYTYNYVSRGWQSVAQAADHLGDAEGSGAEEAVAYSPDPSGLFLSSFIMKANILILLLLLSCMFTGMILT